MMSDPIADMLARLKNASMAGKRVVRLPHSRVKEAIADILRAEGYVQGVEIEGEMPHKTLIVTLKYDGRTSAITDITRKSKPGLRMYVGKHDIPRVVGGMGMAVISTPQGIMTGKKAKKLGIGGELICEVW